MTLPHQLGQIEQPPNTSINQTLEKGMYYARDL